MHAFRRRLVLTMIAALALAGMFSFATHSTAQAHAQVIYDCYFTPSEGYCDNVDPNQTYPGTSYTCASTASTMWTENFDVNGSTWQTQMRYSSHCKTRWTRLVLISGSNGFYGNISGGRTVTDPNTITYGPMTLLSGAWTNMWYAPADTSDSTWQSKAYAYNNSCGAHGYVVYWPSDNSEYPCA